MRRLTVFLAVIALVAVSCGDDDTTATPEVDPGGAPAAPGLRILAIDFTLDSVAILNTADSDISSGGHFLCSEGLCIELDPQPIGPRGSILFQLDEIELDPADGELGLFASDAVDDPDAVRSYVQWGSAGHSYASLAEAAGIWPQGEFVESSEDTTLLTNIDPTATDVANWEASDD